MLPRSAGRRVSSVTTIFAGALLCFFGGVRRGLSFRQKGGPTGGEIFSTVFLFSSGLAGLLLPSAPASAYALAAGFAAEAVLD